MVEITRVLTYSSANPLKPSETWQAYAVLPNGQRWGVVAYGATEAEASDKISTLYLAEREHGKRLGFNQEASDLTVKSAGRGSHLAGKVWALHHASRDKRLVTAEEFVKLQAVGYVKGGAASKFE